MVGDLSVRLSALSAKGFWLKMSLSLLIRIDFTAKNAVKVLGIRE
jgi:hypothetical protein